ncbi:MAG: leucine zipper domain-containing protein [Acidimicrobiaceae bacterium]|nr:leucine zipper domain-containing protein [Acidimicrobiaceae bacterium]
MNTTVRQHPNAALTPIARRKMADLMLKHGWSVKATAERFQVSVKTARRWRDRYTSGGTAGLLGRSSRPRTSPRSTSAVEQAEVIELRQHRRRGAAWIGSEVGLAASTVQKILNNAGLGHLRRGDRATRTPPKRYVRERPGELVHVDVKKLVASIPDGGRLENPRTRQSRPPTACRIRLRPQCCR